ncbi:MAG: GUN4 domain-containing protein [Microcystis sp. M015S2]|nr:MULTISPECIES: GUN4 domain-containing protein [unclassified Microcystis]MCA2709683.1 GUN4 domain-containing protein [Microcystis sp. M025S2]MCA2743206.1 GUN4 domain-containing protein [Microcystis sp. M015S2]MCA2758282.1 GUN4 domain-containing protein [Microcystis sp. M145S2]
MTYKKIAIYEQSYQLPVFKNRYLKNFQKIIKERRKLIQEGVRYHYYFGKIIKRKEKITQQEILIETQLLIKDYNLLINGLEIYQDGYYRFLLQLSDNLKILFSQKYQELKILDYERIKLEIKNNNNNQNILNQLKLEKQENFRAILLLGKTSFLMLRKTKLLGEGVQKLAEDTQKQKKIVQAIIQELKIYEELNHYQLKSQRVRQEIADLAQNAINFENYLQDYFAPFQLLIEEVIKVDEEFYATVGEIKYLVDNIFPPQPALLETSDSAINSEFLLNFLATGYEKEARLKDAFSSDQFNDYLFNESEWSAQFISLEKTINKLSHHLAEQEACQKDTILKTPPAIIVSQLTQNNIDKSSTSKNPQTFPNILTQESADLDYNQLQDLLRKQQWQAADRQTTKLLLKILGRSYWNEVYPQDIAQLPCSELKKIDQLWLHYSHGHFGFSIQQAIFSSLGGLADYETRKKLGDRLGWRKEGKWLNYEQLNFQLEPNSPLGHLPVHWLIFEENLGDPSAEVADHQNSVAFWRVGNWLLWQLHLVFSKIQACGIIPLSDF